MEKYQYKKVYIYITKNRLRKNVWGLSSNIHWNSNTYRNWYIHTFRYKYKNDYIGRMRNFLKKSLFFHVLFIAPKEMQYNYDKA